MSQRDSTVNTLLTATILCVVCSLVVSVAAVGLKGKQEENKMLDRQKNILDAAGLSIGEYGKPASELSKAQIEELYAWVSEELVDLETGQIVKDMDPADYDPREAADKVDTSTEIGEVPYDPGVSRREKVAKVYFVTKPGTDGFQQVVLPVYGKGLWSTLYGYLALKGDLETIQGLTFYEHAETPGLGGEVDNPAWKAQWEDQKLYDENGQPAALVYKGTAPPGNPYAVDGLSGATITSRGVTNLLRYWASEDGYGPFLSQLKNGKSKTSGS
ncbi:Na(+)-translocating NADH-quinone reductase subunit C [Stieleria sp.]|uniref:Na(+)-translocating NADH-quinone reductase subunit C n=1 Tax=Stieleria magnilauensis TaxID=2527963 RepID=A0ABX5XQ29_9BACT|nr:Na(+)-translocating NADH-quinone reductase subunit C [Planctomycetes bacterium TBK1r]